MTARVSVEIMHRLPAATFAVRQCLLNYVLPWLYNMELVDSSLPTTAASTVDRKDHHVETMAQSALLKGRGWGSPEATDMILNNLLYTTVTVSNPSISLFSLLLRAGSGYPVVGNSRGGFPLPSLRSVITYCDQSFPSPWQCLSAAPSLSGATLLSTLEGVPLSATWGRGWSP